MVGYSWIIALTAIESLLVLVGELGPVPSPNIGGPPVMGIATVDGVGDVTEA
jgi:hypothetical protein